MAKQLSVIQSLVQWEARDDTIDLTTVQSLSFVNMLYRRVGALLTWSELSRADVSLSTTADTEEYTWPTTNVYVDVTSIEIQDPCDDLKYKQIVPAKTELEFTRERNKEASFPIIYRRFHNGTTNVIQFAPKPDTASLTVRINGVIEPTDLTESTSTTIFLNNIVDDALAFLIAADIMDQRGFAERSLLLIKRASEILSLIAGREVTVAELSENRG